jgi:hypothetical protein
LAGVGWLLNYNNFGVKVDSEFYRDLDNSDKFFRTTFLEANYSISKALSITTLALDEEKTRSLQTMLNFRY